MIVLGVTGGRSYDKSRIVFTVLNDLHAEWKFTDFVNGQATGADALCRNWAINVANLRIHDYPANWNDLKAPGAVIRTTGTGKPYNKMAGFQRNQEMVDKGRIDLLVAFPGGHGTADMLTRAKKAKIMYVTVNEEGKWQYGDNYLR